MTLRTLESALLSLLLGAVVACAPSGAPPAATQAERGAVSSYAAQPAAKTQKTPRTPDVIYVPTPPDVVDAMLKVAKVGPDDVLYDLGSGDGRIVIAAAQSYGVKRGVGIDIDPKRITEANQNAKKAGVTDRVSFRNEDLFEVDFSEATVVTLYLLPELNLKLRPKLWEALEPGTRVVSHAFDMGDWEPEQRLDIDGRKVFLWTIPAKPVSR
ncbi:MAG TPA: methyltransferase domain-containing protein [Candidatus Eisenbacteria bacterium]|nr:methyltransferase domain-containing protein [Candidatus Eisenbacteria bacterium]